MKAYGKNWRFIDDSICDVDEWDSIPIDCITCECFFECYEEDEENIDE